MLIDIYNNGVTSRYFIYLKNLMKDIPLCVDAIEPFRVVNIGNSDKVGLGDFANAIAQGIRRPTFISYLEMENSDFQATWADKSTMQRLAGFLSQTDMRDGAKWL